LVFGPYGTYYNSTKNAMSPIEHLPAIQSTAWSPDGKQIAFMSQAHDRWEIELTPAPPSTSDVPIARGQVTGVTTQDGALYAIFGVTVNSVSPTWSPDSQQLLFLSDRNNKWEFFVMNPDGSNIRQVLKNVTDMVKLRFDFENERMMDWIR
jgi:Tol biopolymer transport system component